MFNDVYRTSQTFRDDMMRDAENARKNKNARKALRKANENKASDTKDQTA